MEFSLSFFIIIIPIITLVLANIGNIKSWRIILSIIVVTYIVFGTTWALGRYSAAYAQEIWNGQVTSKSPIEKSCPSGWVSYKDDFCDNYSTRIVSHQTCDKDSCTTTYDTEYNYTYDTETRWYVNSNIDEQWEIKRVNARGDKMPPRYEQVQIGDPVSKTNWYNNWILAASDSIHHVGQSEMNEYAASVPAYPIKIYDYYKIDRIINIDVPAIDTTANEYLSKKLSILGPKYQMNAIIIFADSSKYSLEFTNVIQKVWKGFNKNDVVIVVGVSQDYKVSWARVFSWSKNNMFEVQIRNDILSKRNNVITPAEVIDILDKQSHMFERRSFKDFEYLKHSIALPIWLVIVSCLIVCGIPTVGMFVASSNFENKISPIGKMKGFRR